MTNSLYVHIPFCRSICFYCDFCKMYYYQPWVAPYLEALKKELIYRQADRPFQTVYIGGGSPSSLTIDELRRLFEILKRPLSHTIEATMEVNPEDLTLEKAQLMKESGIQRVSLGVQTFDEDLLKKIGRRHGVNTIQQAVAYLHEVGIRDISFDFIYGLPGQTLTQLANDLDLLGKHFDVTHCSFYSLILEDHTIFKYQGVQLKSEEWLVDAMHLISEKLEMMGFERYEISNYCRGGKMSRHNLVYWHNEPYIGIGLGASGYVDHTRYDNTRSYTHYLEGSYTYQTYTLDSKDQQFEALMVGLRLVSGISMGQFKERYEVTPFEAFPKLSMYVKQQFLEIVDGFLRATPQGMDVLDEILVNIME